ncbi:helix-turn-helix transcriptional regulator [Anaerofustis butyriciformans]|uniref:helix-turn-helix transcriptional regulator n=1 Tax=Anaerofustis TaxID=264995 RepID=UPI003F8A8F3F
MKIDRLVTIVITLLEEDKVTVSSLAKKLNVSIRTINRDILELSSAGIPITTIKGKNGGVMIDKEYKTENDILNRDNADTIYSGLKRLDNMTNNVRYKILLDKFKEHPESENNINLSNYFNNSLSDKIDIINDSISKKRVVRFDYFSNNGRVHVEAQAYSLSFRCYSWYLYGYCENEGIFKVYNLDKMLHLNQDKRSFEKKEDIDEKKEIDKIFKNRKGINVAILFDKSVEYRLLNEFGQGSYMHFLDDKLIFEYTFNDKDYLFSWLLTFTYKAKLIYPTKLREEFLCMLNKIKDNYSMEI